MFIKFNNEVIMSVREYEQLAIRVQDISNRLSFASSLGRVILECLREDNVKESDIDNLTAILNIYLRLTNSKLNHLEQYLMRKKL